MKLTKTDHIALIVSDYYTAKEFYVDKLGFELLSQHDRPERGDIILNVGQGDLVLELFVKPTAPKRPQLPQPENQGLRHLAFKVSDVAACLAEFDRLKIKHEPLRYDDYNGKKMAFFFDPDGQPLEIHE
ncbi:SMU1112c/YaeR family gloxylase I-like metalloprotein [Ligilactobacillus agilis]|uniref:Glyoxalase n=1 Tax=Ligilactobacillus agilis TaxID=1601 RepID=A0A6F9Y4S9_9LACO|nr:VOC family protein [Ligilactobacillus agilis]MBL1056284.1 VOC family protein [Ligilactobacillus agilis]MCI5761440.1 VOC family protein [Ligilactobacillus agilis]MDO4597510.1 VOC family protein [Ligilactobacillus agilis]MDY4064619.1 VOC family protein [Ligilactobacillus agilis]GET12539.1 glyoxalase [Ligilactobacillus agilis]